MTTGLATDINNPAFSGAVANPDSLLSVEFYYHEPIDTWASQGKAIPVKLAKMPFIRISVPGKDDTVIERPAHGDDATRFAVQWMRFQMLNGLVETDRSLPGWHIADWKDLTEDQVRFLTYMRFQTVEQLAGASDAQIAAIGMGGLGLREKAKRALAEKMDSGVKEEIAKRDAHIAEQAAKMAALEAKMEAMMARMDTPAPATVDGTAQSNQRSTQLQRETLSVNRGAQK